MQGMPYKITIYYIIPIDISVFIVYSYIVLFN